MLDSCGVKCCNFSLLILVLMASIRAGLCHDVIQVSGLIYYILARIL